MRQFQRTNGQTVDTPTFSVSILRGSMTSFTCPLYDRRMGLFDLPAILLILFVALLVFGPKRLPGLGKSLGTNMREFKESVTGEGKDKGDAPEALEQAPPAPPVMHPPQPAAHEAPVVQHADQPALTPEQLDPITGERIKPPSAGA